MRCPGSFDGGRDNGKPAAIPASAGNLATGYIDIIRK
jgi:hypothetical protein